MILSVAVLVGIAWVVHFAYGLYRHGNSASFSAPAIGLAVNNETGEEAYTALNLTNVMPGGNMYVGLTLANTGSSDLKYSMSATVSGDGSLASALQVGIAVITASSCSSSAYSAGTLLYSGARNLTRVAVSGEDLPPGSTEYLCFHVQMPWGLPNSLQGQSAAATLNFTAVQS
jgi:hypothetical protein